MPEGFIIRTACAHDVAAIGEIYAPYVAHTAITFEYAAPDEAQLRARIEQTLPRYPWLVAERDGALLGYAYLSAFVGRAAYDRAAQTSIYIRKNSCRLGLGRELYAALEAAARAQNILNLYACVAAPRQSDPYLTENSMHFHAHMGYRTVGRFTQCGFKFGRWYDMVWMEKLLCAHPEDPAELLPFSQLGADILAACGILPDEAR